MPVGLLAACGQPPAGNDGAPASRTDAAENHSVTTQPPPEPTPIASATASRPGSTVSEAPVADDSAQAAADVVQRYFALIEARNYREAWVLWRDGGNGSGMSAQAFAGSFAKYADYHAAVGAPGRIDAGAGQRYVTVPVKAYGTLTTGEPFAMEGDLTLHRTADIDGATAEQKSWRIETSGLKPRPAS